MFSKVTVCFTLHLLRTQWVQYFVNNYVLIKTQKSPRNFQDCGAFQLNQVNYCVYQATFGVESVFVSSFLFFFSVSRYEISRAKY